MLGLSRKLLSSQSPLMGLNSTSADAGKSQTRRNPSGGRRNTSCHTSRSLNANHLFCSCPSEVLGSRRPHLKSSSNRSADGRIKITPQGAETETPASGSGGGGGGAATFGTVCQEASLDRFLQSTWGQPSRDGPEKGVRVR